jgi:hypothetical protein
MSFLDTVSGYGDTVDSWLPGDLTTGDIFSNMFTGAKDKALAGISKSLANTPSVQQQMKTTTGNALGNWLIDNWYVPVGLIAVSILGFFLWKGRH